MKILPETRSGKWAVGLATAFVLVFLIAVILSRFNLSLGTAGIVLGLGLGVAGSCALVIGLISLFKNHERSFLAFLSLAVGLYALLFLAFLVWLAFFGGSLFTLNF